MKRYIFILFLSLAVPACTKSVNTFPDSNLIDFDILLSPETRVSGSSFEANDAISLFAVERKGDETMPLQISGNYLNNEKVVYNGTRWSGTRNLYWSSAACDFYAVYPYQKNISSIESYPFRVSVNQNTTENGETLNGYEASDLMFASAMNVSRQNGPVQLRFKHMMSKVRVKIVKGEEFEGEIPDDIVTHIYNTTVDCSVNLSTGLAEKDSFGSKKTITMKKITNELFEAIVVPQNIEKKTPLIEISMGGIAYLLEYSLSFLPGYIQTISVTLNTSPDQENIEISIDPNVHDWN